MCCLEKFWWPLGLCNLPCRVACYRAFIKSCQSNDSALNYLKKVISFRSSVSTRSRPLEQPKIFGKGDPKALKTVPLMRRSGRIIVYTVRLPSATACDGSARSDCSHRRPPITWCRMNTVTNPLLRSQCKHRHMFIRRLRKAATFRFSPLVLSFSWI